jgi:hypothetical protein
MNLDTKPKVKADEPSAFLGKLIIGMAKKAAINDRGSYHCISRRLLTSFCAEQSTYKNNGHRRENHYIERSVCLARIPVGKD